MQARIAQYANELVSLTILGLMVLALVAGQASATPQQPIVPAMVPELAPNVTGLVIDFDFSFRHKGE